MFFRVEQYFYFIIVNAKNTVSHKYTLQNDGYFKVTSELKNSILNPTIIDLIISYEVQVSKKSK